jgi:hypothetical protein
MPMGEFEAIGDAVTGGLLARAVEPQAGEAPADGHTHEKCCLNCGTPLSGPYCFACGQKAHVHRSVRAFFQDFVQGLFNFEGKIWRTLPMLAWHPGEMTRRYIAGERARFISPVALYLFTVFLMFATLNLTGEMNPGSHNFREGLKAGIAEDRQKLTTLETERTAALASGQNVAALERRIAKQKEDLADTERLLSGQAFSSGQVDKDTPSWVEPFIENATKNPEMMSMKVQDAASKYSWLLIPISVPFLWLLFPFRRRYNTYEHTVFVTYSLSFMMMLVVTGSLLVAVGLSSLASLLFFVPPFHMYRHLKESYELGRFSAIMRTMALMTFAFIAAALFIAAAVAIGAM